MNMKLKEFKQAMKNKKIDLCIIVNLKTKDPNFIYFTGIDVDYCFLLIYQGRKPEIISSPLEHERTKKASRIKNIKKYINNPFEEIAEVIKRYKIKKLGLNYSVFTLRSLSALKKELRKARIKNVRMFDTCDTLKRLRAIKTEKELRLLKKACLITDRVFALVINNLKKTNKIKTELDLKRFIDAEIEKKGCTNSFPTIVASGKNSSMPHHEPQNIKLKKGFCVIDFGAKYKGYNADISRTIYFGKPSKKELFFYNFIKNIKTKSAARIKEGKSTKRFMWQVTKEYGKFAKYLIHGLGHGIGTEIHEKPCISLKQKDKFFIGNVFTIEPGIYFPNRFGIRIEDDYILTPKGVKRLTKTSERLIILKG